MKKFFIMFVIFCFSANLGFAAGMPNFDAGTLNRENIRDMRIHEYETRERNKNNSIISTKQIKSSEPQVPVSDIKSVDFINNYSIPTSELLSVIQDKINKPMTNENISAIRKDIMKYYQSKGYFSALAMISAQDTQTGTLIFEIKEGGKNSIIIEN